MVTSTQFFPEGKVIFKEGDLPGRAYLVKSGKVQLYKGADDKKTLLATIEANGIFGEMALLDKIPRSASAVAVENTYCILIDQDEFESRLSAMDPFMKGIFRIITHRLRDTSVMLAAQSSNGTK